MRNLNQKALRRHLVRGMTNLAVQLVDCGFEYSSEFSYDYDNLPSVPRLRHGEGTLQLPIHPICIGSLKRHSYSDKQMIQYFENVIQRKLASSEPIIFYHHPKDGYYDVLDWLFQEMRHERCTSEDNE